MYHHRVILLLLDHHRPNLSPAATAGRSIGLMMKY